MVLFECCVCQSHIEFEETIECEIENDDGEVVIGWLCAGCHFDLQWVDE